MDEDNVYGSGLKSDDWLALRDAILPYLHTNEPAQVVAPLVLPEHLRDHTLVRLIREYQATGDDELLDRAGRLLIPTSEPFGWYVLVTK